MNSENKISASVANADVFWLYEDLNGNFSKIFAFSDRNGRGNNPAINYPAMSHNATMQHSIRGRLTPTDEGARNCVGCNGVAPQDNFDLGRVAYNLDRIVDDNGLSQGSDTHPMAMPNPLGNKRQGAQNTNLAGPLGGPLTEKLTDPNTGLVLDAWISADGVAKGNATDYVSGP